MNGKGTWSQMPTILSTLKISLCKLISLYFIICKCIRTHKNGLCWSVCTDTLTDVSLSRSDLEMSLAKVLLFRIWSNTQKYLSWLYKSLCIFTLKCFSIGTPKIINFPFVSNGKLMIFRCPNIQTDYNEAVLCLNFGTPENNEFSIWDKWKIYYF